MLADRLAHIEPFHVMELLARARALEALGRSIVHMEIGEPDFPTAAPVVAAGVEALERGRTSYTPAAGLPALREAIAAHYARCHGARVAPERIFLTPGASGALLLALALVVNPGDQVLLPAPGYPCNRHFVRTLNGVPVALPVGPEQDYQPTAADLDRAWGPSTAAAMLASPANPTGTLLEAEQLADLVAVSRGRGALIVDEIYHGLTYGREAATAAGLDVFVVNSFSKYFGMTGWRLGWLVVPAGFERAAEKLAQNLFIAAATPAQYAALACFTPKARDIFEARRREFERRRDFLRPALEDLGFRIRGRADGAFYLYADCGALCQDSFEFASGLLERAGVAVTPGRDFGGFRPEAHLRFAYTTGMDALEEGVRRIAQYLGRGLG